MTTYLVTGPIGGGKSEVCRYLSSKGWPVYDCDSRTKRLYSSVPGLKSRIEKALDVPFENLSIIFEDSDRRRKLEEIVYPYLLEDLLQWKGGLQTRLAFVESAIAMDKRQFDDTYDKVILVRADYGSRLARNPKAAGRDALQSFDLNKVDIIIDNNSSLRSLHVKLGKLLKRI